MLLLLSQLRSAIPTELDRFFALWGRLTDSASGGAFTKARKKIRFSAFVELNERLLERFEYWGLSSRWNGYRVLGDDGSTLRLPNSEDIRNQFGQPPRGSNVPLARFSQLVEVGTDVIVATEVAPYSIGEQFLAECHLSALDGRDLVLYDRNYAGFYLMAAHRQRGTHFCIRLSPDRFRATARFARSGCVDGHLTLGPSHNALADCRRMGIDPSPLTLRMVRLQRPDGEHLWVLTNIPEPIPAEQFQALYHERWRCEEIYKTEKHRLVVENFSGTSSCAVWQDVHAKSLLHNLARLFALAADHMARPRWEHRKLSYKVRTTAALSSLRDNLLALFRSFADATPLVSLLQALSRHLEAIRPGRSCPRRNPGARRPGPHRAYKPIS